MVKERWLARAAWLGLTTVTAPLVWSAGATARRLLRSRELISRSRPYVRRLPRPQRRILVAGDSIAAAAGLARPEESVPGLLAERHPDAAIDNVAVAGARWRDLPAQIARASARHYDLALLVAGGNDVLRLTARAALGREVDWALRCVVRRARQVIVVGTPDVGGAPAFGWPLRWLLTARTRMVREVLAQACAARGARFVDLFLEPDADFVAREPELYYAADGLHPSAAGHRYALERIEASLPLAGLLGSPVADRAATSGQPGRGCPGGS